MPVNKTRCETIVATAAFVAFYELLKHKALSGIWLSEVRSDHISLLDAVSGVLFGMLIAYGIATFTLRRQISLEDALRKDNSNLAALNARYQALGKRLREERNRFRTILFAVSDAVIAVGEDGRVLFANPVAQDAFGPTKDAPTFQEYVLGGATLDSQNSLSEDRGPCEILAVDGKYYSISQTPARLGEDNEATVYVLNDISKARALDEAKNEFMATVSHELRTPLSAIKGYVDLILDGDAGPINDVQREFLDIVQRNADRLTNLVNDFLDISKIESGRIQLRKEPLDLATVAQHVVDTFQPQAESKHIELSLTCPDEMTIVFGDISRLTQALMNLANNAIKYTPEGGSVSISIGRRDGTAFVSVSDTGVGISEKDQRRLFSKFFRANNAATRQENGTGLGLTIAKAVAELHDGTLSISSRENEGSTFTISLPVMQFSPEHERIAVETPLDDIPPKGRRKRVLVVDDEPDFVTMVCRYLQRDGYETIAATSAQGAIALAKAAQPDVITLDIMMPQQDGFSALKAIKADPQTRDIPVVILSIIEDEARGRRLGAAAYIHKPLNAEKLRKTIMRVLGPKALEASRGRAILIASRPSGVESMKKELESAGYTIHVAANKREALDIARRKQPIVAILDISPLDMDSLRLMKELKQDSATADIPLVVTGDGDLSGCYLLGMASGQGHSKDVSSLLAGISDIVKHATVAAKAASAGCPIEARSS